ncbi:MAG: pantoate--beta-alanine ligase [Chloroflexi bacterium]|nr:pantoate--beta-alanine ligase [Chloroflexota bacterium]
MQVCERLTDLRAARAALPERLGLIPTMGFLHEGHLALIHRARNECAAVGISIFVNPAQFGPLEDFSTYPRAMERDLELLAKAEVDLVWTPSVADVYPPGFQSWVEVEQLSRPLEGSARPGHFRGVTTVVAKLFNAFEPRRAYFGQKDIQQARVIEKMIDDLNFNVELRVVPTVRAEDGLALSSRNVYLNPEQRRAAPALYRGLVRAKAVWETGKRDAARLRRAVATAVAAEPLLRVDYVSVADLETLTEQAVVREPAIVSAATFAGHTRLIDNIILGHWPALVSEAG